MSPMRADSMDYYKPHIEKADAEMEPLLEPDSESSTQYEENSARGRGRCHRFGPRKNSKRRKALRFILASILTYLFIRFVVCDVSNLVRGIKSRHAQKGGEREFSQFKDITDFISQSLEDSESDDSLPDGISITDCIPWAQATQHADGHHHKFTSKASLTIVSIPEKFFILSRGPLSAGSIRIVHSDSESDPVRISTTFKYNKQRELALAEVCALKGAEGATGVGLFSHLPHRRRRHDKRNLRFDITLQLPKNSSMKNLTTDTPFLAHLVDDLSSGVYFESISLGSTFMPISVEGISAETGIISSGFGPIEGNFITNGSLVLSTSFSPIKANITLINSNEESPTEVFLKTAKSPITANLTLLSTSESYSGEGGKFKVDSQGSISPITLSFPSAPLKSSLNLNVRTSISPARVSLHPTYQGSFDLHTSLATATVRYNEDEEDPEGEGRKRRVDFDEVDGSARSGSVEWEEGGKGRGSVVVESSIGPVELFL